MQIDISDLRQLIKEMENDKEVPTGEPTRFHQDGQTYLVQIDIEHLKAAVAHWDEEELGSVPERALGRRSLQKDA